MKSVFPKLCFFFYLNLNSIQQFRDPRNHRAAVLICGLFKVIPLGCGSAVWSWYQSNWELPFDARLSTLITSGVQ